MALVTGSTQDLANLNLASAGIEIWFIPESQGHGFNTPTVRNGWLFAGRAGKASFVEGSTREWEVDLQPTEGLRPLTWYRVKIVYLNPGGQFTSEEWVPVKLFVPYAGGVFSDLVNVDGGPGKGAVPSFVWWSPDEPPNPQAGDIWVNTVTGDVKEY